ncbi:protein NETWORKED 3C [Ziziphus jujuba]|uniref:Protein NETWORKED 3C n=2 Tax=Ziziphus jujuba TaxID=326968 RepID=A0A6P6GP49_ZIZJJ|nr:protein NETWORKED 3C [Ziziphus jujuba]KAH7516799.1 hypothetical protein FEM48_Zijuj10G0173100 [Ziziphus jujuba var. spinosa]
MEKMVSNEKKKEGQTAALSWCWNSHNNDLHKSQWLETTLSELDDKIKLILSMIEEDGDSFAKRAKMFYERRPELIKVLEDLHKSYRSLAEKYDHLNSGLSHALHSASFSSLKALRHVHSSTHHQMNVMMINPDADDDQNSLKLKAPAADQHHHHHHLDDTEIDYECLLEKKKKKKKFDYDDDDYDGTTSNRGSSDGEEEYQKNKKTWSISGKEVMELIEDHVRQRGELIRRNKEKRETIKDLRNQVNRLIGENQALKDCLHSLQPSTRLKSPSFFGKLTGCTGSTL